MFVDEFEEKKDCDDLAKKMKMDFQRINDRFDRLENKISKILILLEERPSIHLISAVEIWALLVGLAFTMAALLPTLVKVFQFFSNIY